MSQPFDLSQFPDLPPEVVKAFAVVQFELSVERATRQHEQSVVAAKEAFIEELEVLIEKLEGQAQDYRPTKFGPKSEKLDSAQLELALEDLDTAIAETQAQIAAVGQDRGQRTGSREAQAASTTQGPGAARKPAPRREGGRARQHRLPLWLW
jgi:hypothetical protein